MTCDGLASILFRRSRKPGISSSSYGPVGSKASFFLFNEVAGYSEIQSQCQPITRAKTKDQHSKHQHYKLAIVVDIPLSTASLKNIFLLEVSLQQNQNEYIEHVKNMFTSRIYPCLPNSFSYDPLNPPHPSGNFNQASYTAFNLFVLPNHPPTGNFSPFCRGSMIFSGTAQCQRLIYCLINNKERERNIPVQKHFVSLHTSMNCITFCPLADISAT